MSLKLVCVEGESGILGVHPKDFRPQYEPSKRRLTWPNGARATLYNATEPDQLRGPQHSLAWCDEFATAPEAPAMAPAPETPVPPVVSEPTAPPVPEAAAPPVVAAPAAPPVSEAPAA